MVPFRSCAAVFFWLSRYVCLKDNNKWVFSNLLKINGGPHESSFHAQQRCKDLYSLQVSFTVVTSDLASPRGRATESDVCLGAAPVRLVRYASDSADVLAFGPTN